MIYKKKKKRKMGKKEEKNRLKKILNTFNSKNTHLFYICSDLDNYLDNNNLKYNMEYIGNLYVKYSDNEFNIKIIVTENGLEIK